jgi:hypothetical protein
MAQAIDYGDLWIATLGEVAAHVRALGLEPRQLTRPEP